MNINETQNPEFLAWLISAIPRGSKVLDIGCGSKWYHDFIDAEFTSIDAHPSNAPDYLIDLEEQDLPRIGHFDFALLIDVVEHLNKERGREIICQAKEMADRVILLTPLGWDNNLAAVEATGNPYQKHKSLWRVDDFGWWQQVKLSCFAKGVNRDPKYVHGYFLGILE